MARGRRKHIIQSHEEYLSEELLGQRSNRQNIASSTIRPSTREDQSDSENELIATGQHQNIAGSEFDPSSEGDPSDRDSDAELNFEEETQGVKKRGKTKLLDVWNIPRGRRIVINCNELDQPVGEEAGILGKFLGMVARNGCLCSLSFKDWRLLIGKKQRTNNETTIKESILKQVKLRFLYPSRMEKWILRTIGERWRQHKSNLKSMYFDAHLTKESNYSNVPPGVIADQWVALVNNWMTPKAQDISESNRINCAKRKAGHTAGPKSFARTREELKDQDPEKKYPHRAVLYIHTHRANSNNSRNVHVGQLKELLAEHPDLADTSQGKDAWKGDALNRILGEDKPGHVHGLGLVPNPDKVLDGSASKRLKHLNVTSLDATSCEDVVALRLQMEKLVNRIHNQDATIQDLQQKTTSLERKQKQHGCLDDPLSTPIDVQATSIRKRICVEPQSPEFRVHEDLNYSTREESDANGHADLQQHDKNTSTNKDMSEPNRINVAKRKATQTARPKSFPRNREELREESDADEHEDVQPHYKHTSTIKKANVPNSREENFLHVDTVATTHKAKPKEFHTEISLDNNSTNALKGMNHDPPSNCSTDQALKYQTKAKEKRTDITLDNRRSTNASKVRQQQKTYSSKPEASKYQHGTADSSDKSIMVGTDIFLKSWRNQTKKNVALATVLGTDPKYKVGGVQLGNQFYMVRVGHTFVPDEPLIRPYSNFKVIGDVRDDITAWPSSCIEKVNN